MSYEQRPEVTLDEVKNSQQEQEKSNKGKYYSDDLRSRFGKAFLPYATMLESVEYNRTKRKRKGKNKKRQLTKITAIPSYKNDTKMRLDLYHKKLASNKKKIKEKTKKIINKEEVKEKTTGWYGDIMTLDDEWPNVEKKKTIRIFHINLNGITYQNNYLEWEMTMAFLVDMQVDIFGLTEVNLDLNNGIVRDNFIQSSKHFDKHARLAVSSSLQEVGKSPFKMGGTVTGTNGCWSGRIIKQGSDTLGRWSYMSLQAKKGKLVTFITIYLPRKPTSEGGGTTIYSQMEADLLHRDKKLGDPRKALLADLHKLLDEEKKRGNMVILMGDVNDDLGLERSQIREFLTSVGMKIPYTIRHGADAELPATHDRGKTCLDLIGCSEQIPDEAIVRTGYAPFYFNFFTDHRGVYLDLDIESIFNSTRPDTTKHIYKRFTTTQVPKCSRYLKKLEELIGKARISQEVEKLENMFKDERENKDDIKKEVLIGRTKLLFQKVTEFMLCAERKSGPSPYRDGFPDSPKLRETAFRVILLKKYLRMLSLGTIKAEENEKEEAAKELKTALLDL